MDGESGGEMEKEYSFDLVLVEMEHDIDDAAPYKVKLGQGQRGTTVQLLGLVTY